MIFKISSKWLASTMLFGLAVNLMAQQGIRVQTVVMPDFPVRGSEYFLGVRGPNIMVTVTNTGRATATFNLLPTLSNPSKGISVRFAPRFIAQSPITLAASETRAFNYSQLRQQWSNADLTSLALTGISADDLANKNLPEGFYQYCFEAIDGATGGVISNTTGNCGSFQLKRHNAPIVTTPQNQSTVKPNDPQFLIFNWTPTGVPNETLYRLVLIDMTENRLAKPEDAYLSQAVQPYFSIDNLSVPNFAYNITHPPLLPGRTYAVRVQAYSRDGSLSFLNNGISQVITFTYGEAQQARAGSGLLPPKDIKGTKLPKDDMVMDLATPKKFPKAFKGDDGGIFYLDEKSVGGSKYITIYGEHPGLEYGIVFKGQMYNNKFDTLSMQYAAIPKYKSQVHGNLKFAVSPDYKKLTIFYNSGTLPFKVLESISLGNYINMLPPVIKNARYAEPFYNKETDTYRLTGLYKGSDGGWYYARQIEDKFYMVGEAEFEPGSKPDFVKVFAGNVGMCGGVPCLSTSFSTMIKGNEQNNDPYVSYPYLKYYLEENDKLNPDDDKGLFELLMPADISITKCSKWTRIKSSGTIPIEPDKAPAVKKDPRPSIKAEKSASLVFFYFGDGPLTTIFQNAGVNLQYALDGYDKTCLLKSWFSDVNKSPDYSDQPTKINFFKYLKKLAEEGYYIDIFVFTHGSRAGIETMEDNSLFGPEVPTKYTITAADIINELGSIYQQDAFPIRMVYQMNCHGSRLNEAFVQVGAKAVVGSNSVNFCPTRFNVFGEAWQNGTGFYQAVRKSEEDGFANSLAASGINTELKLRAANPLSWKCKSCPTWVSLKDKKDCLGCFFKSFYGIRGVTDETPEEAKPNVVEEYDYEKTGLGNLLFFSYPIINGKMWNLTKNTKPTW